MTRLRDVVEPRLSGTKRVLDLSGGGWIAGFLHLPDGIDLISTPTDELAATIRPNDLVLDAVPVQSGEDGLLTYVRTVVSQLAPGASAVLLTRDAAVDLPLDGIGRVTAAAGCQLLEVAELGYPAWPSAVVVGQGAESPTGESAVPGPPAFLGRGSFGHDSFARGSSGHPAATAGDATGGPADETNARLRAQLLEREQTIGRLRRDMRAIRSSVGLQLGSALVEAAKKPSAVPRLPGRLVKVLRGRDRSGAKSAGLKPQVASAVLTSDVASVSEDSLLLAWSGEPTDRTALPEIFGVVTDLAATMLSHHSALRRLLPHEARLALERALPDLVLIQASALLAPSIWRHTGTPGGAVSYARSLYDMVVLAGMLNVPVVVWQDVRPSMTPALGALLSRADLVIGGGENPGAELSWSPGVSLAAFHPTAKTATDKVFVVQERRVTAASMETRFRRELERAEVASVHQLWSPDLMDAVRAHAVALASPLGGGRAGAISDLTLASIASGARVLSGPNDALLSAFPSAVVPVSDPGNAVGAVKTLLAAPELSAVEQRLNLRHIFDFESTPVRLGRLAGTLGLRHDPMASRRVTVVIQGVGVRETAAALDNVLSQSYLPARILVSADEVPDRALDEVRELGIDVAVVGPPRSWSALAAATDSDWVMVWRNGAPAPRGLLHDLLTATEWVRGDVVGALPGPSAEAGYGRFVDTLPIEGSLIRRELLTQLGPGTDLSVLAERGLRLFAVHDAGSDR